MDIVPRIGRPERRHLLQMARKSGDLPTALRFLIVARLGLRETSSEVASGPAALFCDLLKLLATSYDTRVRRIHLVVDNYAIHSARATRRVLEELGHRIVLHFLPPYCPDANRIERVWQDLHANVTRNHRCKTMKALLGNSRAYLEGYVWHRVTGAAPILRRAA